MKLDEQSVFNVTDWFPTSINPVHIGFYQVHTPNYKQNHYSFWNGVCWEICMCESKHAFSRIKSVDMYDNGVKWRGLNYKVT